MPPKQTTHAGWRHSMIVEGTKDQPTVTPAGERVSSRISGVVIRRATSHEDERGELCEVFNPAWQFDTDPLVYVYQTSIRPGKIKGWVYHKLQDDRLFVSRGSLKIVLFDPREGSPTKGMINEIHLSERNRALVRIPRLVLHAVQNIGTDEALFINMPTTPYDHLNPDKYRIPINSKSIPYTFTSGSGW